MEKEIRFQDIFNVSELQELMRSLSLSLEVGLVIRGPKGERYTEDYDYCELCRTIKKSAIGRERCERSDKILSEYKPLSPYICSCKSAGLVDAGINIMIGDVHIASILVGQVRISEYEYTDEEYRVLARELGIDEEEYMQAFSIVPRKTKKQFNNILETLTLIARQLSKLGFNNLYQKNMIDSMSDHEQMLLKEKTDLKMLAEQDALTGLNNRRKLEAVMSELEKEGKNRQQVFMVSIDVNYLKITNDIFGHEVGDKLLKVVAKCLKELAGPGWIVARCGGDEFRVLTVGVSNSETVLNYCDMVNRNCLKDSSINVPATFSYGIAHWEEGESISSCFKRADRNMYDHKYKNHDKQNYPDMILEKLYDRNILDKSVVEGTVELAERFARFMGYDSKIWERLIMASRYMDLGMAQVPERVMLKSSQFSDETWRYLHAHPVIGNLLAKQFEKTKGVADIILQSHEAWDGKGYPNGLKGEEISIEARIIRLIDSYTFWVMPSENCTERTPSEVKDKIESQKGTTFEPALVEQFMKFLASSEYGE